MLQVTWASRDTSSSGARAECLLPRRGTVSWASWLHARQGTGGLWTSHLPRGEARDHDGKGVLCAKRGPGSHQEWTSAAQAVGHQEGRAGCGGRGHQSLGASPAGGAVSRGPGWGRRLRKCRPCWASQRTRGHECVTPVWVARGVSGCVQGCVEPAVTSRRLVPLCRTEVRPWQRGTLISGAAGRLCR